MKDMFAPATYILASARNGTLYTGTTSNLMQRLAQHRGEVFDGFSARYGIKALVWPPILASQRCVNWIPACAGMTKVIETTHPAHASTGSA